MAQRRRSQICGARSMVTRLLAVVGVFAASDGSAVLAGRPVELSDAQMRMIALAAVRATTPQALQLPKFELDGEQTSNGYVTYEGMADTPGSVHVGFYVVDPRTGDVWDGVSACGEINSPELWRLRAKIRAQIGLPDRRYSEIRRAGPLCDQPAGNVRGAP